MMIKEVVLHYSDEFLEKNLFKSFLMDNVSSI